jgi:uncharacterized protein YceK
MKKLFIFAVLVMVSGCAITHEHHTTHEYHTTAKIIVDEKSADWQKNVGPTLHFEYSITR